MDADQTVPNMLLEHMAQMSTLPETNSSHLKVNPLEKEIPN